LNVPEEWANHALADLMPPEHVRPFALARGGRAVLPAQNVVLQEQDILQVSATSEGVALLRQRLKTNGD